MMKQEFEQLAGYEVSSSDYHDIIEPMYMATNLTKQEFVKTISKERFALPTKAQMRREMKKIAKMIFENCGRRSFWQEEAELQRIAWEYAERFYGIRPGSRNEFVFFTRDYALYSVRQHQGCTFPETLVIEYSDELREIEYERINLIA